MPFARHTLDAFQFCQVSVRFYDNLTKYFFVINIWLKLFVVTMVREIVKTGTWKYPSDILLISDHRNTQQTETKYDLENVEKPLAPLKSPCYSLPCWRHYSPTDRLLVLVLQEASLSTNQSCLNFLCWRHWPLQWGSALLSAVTWVLMKEKGPMLNTMPGTYVFTL